MTETTVRLWRETKRRAATEQLVPWVGKDAEEFPVEVARYVQVVLKNDSDK